MDLFALTGNTLKVYLGLVVGQGTREVCVLSHSALGRTVRLARHTVLRALHQLEQGGWIQGEAGRWQVTKAPRVDLVGLLGVSPMDAPDAEHAEGDLFGGEGADACAKITQSDPPASQKLHSSSRPPCAKIAQLDAVASQKLHSSSRPSTRTRTLWSSSYEEDSTCTAVPPHPEGGLGGTKPVKKNGREKNDPNHPEESPGEKSRGKDPNPAGRAVPNQGCPPVGTETAGDREGSETIPQDDYQRAMQALWPQIAPGHPEHPTSWFQELRQAFGSEVPVVAFQQFVDQGKTLADLAHPDRYQRYLRACCRTAQQAPPALRKPVRSTQYRQPPTDDDYNQDLTALYQARRNRHDPAYDEDWEALHRSRLDPSLADSSHSLPAPGRAERRRA